MRDGIGLRMSRGGYPCSRPPPPFRGTHPPLPPRRPRTVSRTVLACRGMLPHRPWMHPHPEHALDRDRVGDDVEDRAVLVHDGHQLRYRASVSGPIRITRWRIPKPGRTPSRKPRRPAMSMSPSVSTELVELDADEAGPDPVGDRLTGPERGEHDLNGFRPPSLPASPGTRLADRDDRDGRARSGPRRGPHRSGSPHRRWMHSTQPVTSVF